jgi:four helix bundle protein
MDLTRFKLIDQADQISSAIWEEVHQWSIFNKDTVGKQMVRAADSITANLGEAYGRYSFADRKRFAYYARGSLCETMIWIKKSVERRLIQIEKGEELLNQLGILSHQLNCYINLLK